MIRRKEWTRVSMKFTEKNNSKESKFKMRNFWKDFSKKSLTMKQSDSNNNGRNKKVS